MPRLIVVDRGGQESSLEGRSGLSVMEAIREGGLDELHALCGGCGSCATCHVHVDDPWLAMLPPGSEDEDDLLDSSACRQFNSRLSCQILLSDALEGMRVTVAPED
jgi:2Fe-2S ferredoxin